jgi:serine protease Do
MRKGFVAALAIVTALVLVAASGQAATHKGQGGWLGVYTQTVDKDLAEVFKLSVDHGSIINKIVADSPADKAGLKVGDIVVSINGKDIASSGDLVDMIAGSRKGDVLELGIVRDKVDKTISVTLDGKLDDDKAAARKFGWNESPSGILNLWDSPSYIGVDLVDLSPQLASYFGLERDGGALVSEVSEDSPAEKAGIKAGDVIIAVGDDEVTGYGDVGEFIREMNPGDSVTVKVLRDKKELSLAVVVGKRDDEAFGYIHQYKPGSGYDIYLPKVKRQLRGSYDNLGVYFDKDKLDDEMTRLRKEMQKMQEELKEIKRKME